MKKQYIVSFDARNDHERIIKDLLAKGWHSVALGRTSDNEKLAVYLPNTTWYKEFISSRAAAQEMEEIVGRTNILRFTAAPFEEWFGGGYNPMPHQIEEAKELGYKSLA